MKDSKYYKKKIANKVVTNHGWLTKLLLSIIIFLVSLIVYKFANDVLEKNINFGFFNKYYKKFMSNNGDETEEVSNTLEVIDKEEIDGRYKISCEVDSPVSSMVPGLIVFYGEEEGLSNTVIIQGNDGVDIWYSGISLHGYSIYDYVREGDILGSSNDEYIMLSIIKDGEKLKYEEYFK